MERHVRKLVAERGAIDALAGPVEPFVHLRGVIAHLLSHGINWELNVFERAAGGVSILKSRVLPLGFELSGVDKIPRSRKEPLVEKRYANGTA